MYYARRTSKRLILRAFFMAFGISLTLLSACRPVILGSETPPDKDAVPSEVSVEPPASQPTIAPTPTRTASPTPTPIPSSFRIAALDHARVSYRAGTEAQGTPASLSAMQAALNPLHPYFNNRILWTAPQTATRVSGQLFTPLFNSGGAWGRASHSMAELDGKLYVFGGGDSVPALRNDLWSFDLATNAWALLKADDNAGVGVVDVNFPKKRQLHAMAAWNGKLYVFGGFGVGVGDKNDLWSFDLATNTWALLKAENNAGLGAVNVDFPTKRENTTMAAWGGKLYIVGGIDSGSRRNDVWSFDLTTNSWALLKADDNAGVGSVDLNYPARRYSHAMAISGGKLHVFGGLTGTGVYRNDVWSFDLATNTWALLKADDNAGVGAVNVNFPKKRSNQSMAVNNGKLYVFGGVDSAVARRNDLWSFDLATNAWALVKADDNAGVGVVDANFPSKRVGPTMAASGGKLYVFGGVDTANVRQGDVWSYDLTTNTWTLIQADDNAGLGVQDINFPRIRQGQSMAESGGKLYVFGGYANGTSFQNDVWSFDPATSAWTLLKANDNAGAGVADVDFPQRRNNHAMAVSSGKLYVFGGDDGSGMYRNDVWSFDLTTKIWTLLFADDNGGTGAPDVDFPDRRALHTMAASNGKLYVFGGDDNSGIHQNDVWSFDPTTKAWTLLKDDDNAGSGAEDFDFPKRRYGHAMTEANEVLYIFGGYDSANYRNDVWSFDLASSTWTLLIADDNAGAGAVDVAFPGRRIYTGMAESSGKLYLFGGADNMAAYRNDFWKFDLTTNTWTLLKADNNAGVGVAELHYPRKRAYSSTAGASNGKLYVFGGGDDSGAMRNDLWVIDPASVRANQSQEILLTVDLTPTSGTLATNATLLLSAVGSGDLAGALAYGAKVYAWNFMTQAFVEVAANTANSRASSTMNVMLDLSYRDADDKLYLLIQSAHGQGGVQGSSLDLDLSQFILSVDYYN